MAAGFGIWLYVSNRVILHWASSTAKVATMATFAVGLTLLARALRLRAKPSRWIAIPLVIVGGFSVGELQRAWLRHKYRCHVETAELSVANLVHPWTTTDLQVPHRQIAVPYAIERLRIVHLTDLHITPALPFSYYASIVERSNAEAPDVVVMTGDFLSKADHLGLLQRWLALPLHARFGTYAVLGNHDYWAGVSNQVRQALETAHVRVLSGSCARLSQDAHRHVILCGTEWPWGPDFVDSVSGVGDFVLALSHTPDNIYSLLGRARAVFSGHYHGGQWRVPGVGALIVPSAFGRRLDRGHFSVDGTELFVSAGLGADFPPLRLYCPPELLVVDFVSDLRP
jgi:uncharacterized protein